MRIVIPDYMAPVKADPGEVLLGAGLVKEALPFLEARFNRDPKHPRGRVALGIAFFYLDRFKESEDLLHGVIDSHPEFPLAWHALGNMLEGVGRFDEALSAYQTALYYAPDNVSINFGVASGLMRKGCFDEAWDCWHKGRGNLTVDGIPFWEGEPLEGKRLLVIREGGYGDVFWLLRYFPILKQMGAHITLYSFSNCRGLLMKHPWIDEYMDSKIIIDTEGFDYQVPLMSILSILKVCPLPMEGPYFHAAKPFPRNGHTRVGICWRAGEMGGVVRKIRCLTSEEMEPLKSIPVEWVSLQLGEEIPAWIEDKSESIRGWHRTADMIESLDLVVTVDTAVAHLAGAMGKKTYLMLPLNCEWKWAFPGAETAWYNTVKIFRNDDPVSMSPAVNKVIEQLRGDFSC